MIEFAEMKATATGYSDTPRVRWLVNRIERLEAIELGLMEAVVKSREHKLGIRSGRYRQGDRGAAFVSARQEANNRVAHRDLVTTFYAGLSEARQMDPPGYCEIVAGLMAAVEANDDVTAPTGTTSWPSYDAAVAKARAWRDEHRSVVRFERWSAAGGVARMQHVGLHPFEVREFGHEVGTQLVKWAYACVDRTLSLAPSAPLPGAVNFPTEAGVRLSLHGQQLIATISIPKPHVETLTTAVNEQREAA